MSLAELQSLVAVHDDALTRWYDDEEVCPPAPSTAVAGEAADLSEVVREQHRANFCLWNLEDQARRRDVDDGYIAAIKRSIDAWNQRRNDLIELIDVIVLARFDEVDRSGAEQHSETVGMMIDRLSILALKVYHMDANSRRDDDVTLAEECRARLEALREQRHDLAACLARLLDDVSHGRRFFKLYRQHKAYNDPRLNPACRQ